MTNYYRNSYDKNIDNKTKRIYTHDEVNDNDCTSTRKLDLDGDSKHPKRGHKKSKMGVIIGILSAVCLLALIILLVKGDFLKNTSNSDTGGSSDKYVQNNISKSGKEIKKIYNHFNYISKNLHISEDDDRLYLTTFGGGVLKLENLKSLY